MNKKLSEAEILDHFLDALLLDTRLTPPQSGEPDQETSALLRHVVLVEGGHEDDLHCPERMERIWQRVVSAAQAVSQPVSRTVPGSHQFLPSLFKRWQSVALVGIFILAAITISLYTLARHPTPVSAQEILTNAYTALSSPSTGGVHSFTLTEVWRAFPSGTGADDQGGLPGDGYILTETRRWYEAPNRWRSEVRQQVLSAGGQEVSRSDFQEISDGTTVWYYDLGRDAVTINQYTSDVDGKGGVALFGQDVGVLTDLLKQASTCYDPKVTGSDTVAGRIAHVIDLGPTRCPSASAPEMNGRLILWVDEETYFVLKQELYDPAGNGIVMTSEVTQIQYNPSLDPGLFTFTPPAGAGITDNRPLPAPAPDVYQSQLAQLAEQLDYPLFVPGYIPAGLEPRQPRLRTQEGNLVELAYVPPDEVGQDTSAAGNGILIRQQMATSSLVANWTEGADPVALPAGMGWLRTGIRNPAGTGADSAALILRDGTLASISSFTVSPDELVKVAASLNPVPGSHAPLPNPDLPPLETAPLSSPTPPAAPSFDPLLPTWLPEEATRSTQADGDIVTLSFDPHPGDAPHSVLTLVEMPAAMVMPGGSPDPQATQEQIGGIEVTVIRRGENCMTFEWKLGELYLQLTNPYDPPGQPRYSCDQLYRIVTSIR